MGVLALLAAGSAFGQQKMQYQIPFEFHFMDTVLPAGQYSVDTSSNSARNFVSLDCFACKAHVTTVTFAIGGGANMPDEGRLVFNKYGDAYYLSQVWVPGYSQGGQLNKSKTEREIARITQPAQTSQVILALR